MEKVCWYEICFMLFTGFVGNIFCFDKYVVSFALDSKQDKSMTICEVPVNV
jgi:hypothetical protein